MLNNGKILSLAVALAAAIQMTQPGWAYGDCSTVQNEYVEIGLCATSPGGRSPQVLGFGMRTTGGEPAAINDRDQDFPIVFQFEPSVPREPWTTRDLLSVDGESLQVGDVSLGRYSMVPTVTRPGRFGEVSATFRFDDTHGAIVVDKSVELSSDVTGKPDTAKISWTLRNDGAQTRQVGLRSDMDVQIGPNDGAPVLVDGAGVLSTSQEFAPGETDGPSYWLATDDPGRPTVVVRGTVKDVGDATPPDTFQFHYWPTISANWPWYVPVLSSIPADLDSAMVYYWEPIALAPGESVSYVTYYGLDVIDSCDSFQQVSLDAPGALEELLPCGTFETATVELVVETSPAQSYTNLTAELIMPSGLSLISGQPLVNLGDVGPDELRTMQWEISATDDGRYPLRVVLQADGPTLVCDRAVSITVVDHPDCSPTPTPTPTPTATPTPEPTPVGDFQPPRIQLAGYGQTSLGCGVGTFHLLALIADDAGDLDPQSLEVQFGGVPTGLRLEDVDGSALNSAAGDGLYGLYLPDVPQIGQGSRTLLEITAADIEGNETSSWPYVPTYSYAVPPPSAPSIMALERAFINRSALMPSRLDEPRALSTLIRNPDAPVVFAAGYGDTALNQTTGGELDLRAIITDPQGDIAEVRVLFDGLETGLRLELQPSGFFGLSSPLLITEPLPPGLLLEIEAEDAEGNVSDLWPYMTVHDCP